MMRRSCSGVRCRDRARHRTTRSSDVRRTPTRERSRSVQIARLPRVHYNISVPMRNPRCAPGFSKLEPAAPSRGPLSGVFRLPAEAAVVVPLLTGDSSDVAFRASFFCSGRQRMTSRSCPFFAVALFAVADLHAHSGMLLPRTPLRHFSNL